MKVTLLTPDDPTVVALAVADPPANVPSYLEVVFGSDGTTRIQTDPPEHHFGRPGEKFGYPLKILRAASAFRAGDIDAAEAERELEAILAEWSASTRPR